MESDWFGIMVGERLVEDQVVGERLVGIKWLEWDQVVGEQFVGEQEVDWLGRKWL